MGGLLEMSKKELDRLIVLQKVLSKELKQIDAAGILSISDRQVRNLMTSLKTNGSKGIISKHRGKKGNNRKSNEFKESVLALVSERYEGFGPTLAKEKLEEWHDLKLSKETLRLWMIEHNLWVPRKKRKKLHLPRQRRECFGELIQADGSHHRWFGKELPAVNATVFIDDATSMLTSLVFSEEETTDSYFIALEQHMTRYGRPRALYTDHYSIFQTSKGNGITQMQRALIELDIELILANSPQAKGKVERANRTLQDRLLKELWLRGVRTVEQANAYAPEFIEQYNKKFSKKPMKDFDAHRLLEGYDLDRVLSRCEVRTLLSDVTFQFNNKIFKVQGISDVRRAKGRKVEVRVRNDGQMRVFMKEKELQVALLEEVQGGLVIPELSRKEVIGWQPRKWKAPPESHPWKRYSYHSALREKRKRKEANLV